MPPTRTRSIFGDRLPIYYDPAAVRAMAPHVDAIATNYNVDSSDGWIARLFLRRAAKIVGRQARPRLRMVFRRPREPHRQPQQRPSDDGRDPGRAGCGAAAATANFAAIPEIVGVHWFQYYDHPKGGRTDGEDYDFGLVDIDDRPYERLTAALAAANRRAPLIHAAAAVRRLRQPEMFALPHAPISVHDRSLSDWPKPASLLPRLSASPGAVEFGEAYLSWSERGLALATIGQDYFDIDLLAYDGAFPLVDAYRVELGVDLGAGPRRFTLFFIPPRTKVQRSPADDGAKLCAGPAQDSDRLRLHRGRRRRGGLFRRRPAAHHRRDGDPVVGARRRAAGPGTRLRAEIAVTSWHRERWMSLSGRAPDRAMADPAELARDAARQRRPDDRDPALASGAGPG